MQAPSPRHALMRRCDCRTAGNPLSPRWRPWATLAALLVALAVGLCPPGARAQDQLRDFTKPILVLNTGGHHAPVRSLVFTPDGTQLLSGGLDKVVHRWSVQGARPSLDGTFRPPIWRGAAGVIYAMALQPTADPQGTRVLAVGGFGVEANRGNIGLFHFPGPNSPATGDHFAELIKDDPNDPGVSGHRDTVTCLAFDPTGKLLASGSNDTTARIWDWSNRRTTAVLRGHAAAINALGFLPDGTHLVTGGRDGSLRLWDLARPDAPIAIAPALGLDPLNPLGTQINALAISSDGRWVVIGREDGRIIRYDAATLANETVLSASAETVEALALSPDGTRLATSSIGRLLNPGELPRLACSIQVRRFPDGANRREILRLDNVAYTCAFSPDSQTLAVAGGDQQAITLIRNRDAAAAAIQTTTIKGQGRSIWDVGLRDDRGRLAVAFSHDPDQNLHYPPRREPASPRYQGMILPAREATSYDVAELSRGLLQYDGWSVRPVDQFHLDVVRANEPARTFRITLDEIKDRRWKSYSFVPPGPEHARLTLAVGCEAGVWFYTVDEGRPTRLYAGHSGPVYCMAPSRDGRWLATGSSDQTVRLWTLAGCDTVPVLGAEFERRGDGSVAVKSVEPLGFADAMGLKAGDVPIRFGLAGKEVTADDFLARYASQLPNVPIQLIVRRQAAPPEPNAPARALEDEAWLITTKRNSPALSFFFGEDREWVLWMPSGYYDTSIAGDSRFLGWHLNQATIFDPRPTDYLEINKFEKQLRQPRRAQPNKLDTLLERADLALALAIPYPPAPLAAPPRPTAGPEPRLNVRPDGVPGALPDVPPAARPALPPIALRLPQGADLPAAPAPETRPAAAAEGGAVPPVTTAAATPDPTPPVAATPGGRTVGIAAGTTVAQGTTPSGSARINPGASNTTGTPVTPPATPRLAPLVIEVPAPQRDVPADARARSATAAPLLVIEAPALPQPEPAPAANATATLTATTNPARAPAPAPDEPTRDRVAVAGPQPQPLVIARAPLPPLALRAPVAPELPPLRIPPGPQVGERAGQGPGQLIQPPLSPAEFVERSQPPTIEPRVQPLPNQQITTLDGKPFDVREAPPEKIAIGDLDADGRGSLLFDLTIDAQGRIPARSIDYRVDGRPFRQNTVFDRPVALHREAVKLSLAPGPHRFTAEVANELGVKRSMYRDIYVRGTPRPRPTRLKVWTLAPTFQENAIPPIRFADRDVKDLRKFFARYLVSPEDGSALYSIDEELLEGASATTDRVQKAIDGLKDDSLGEGDLVVVVIESHLLTAGGERRLVASNSMSIPPSPTVPAEGLARNLGALARQGCKVLVLLDTVHTASGKDWDIDINDWVRQLRDEHGVITFVASNSGPSQLVRDQSHRAFAQAVLDSVKPPILKDGPYLLNDFREVVIDRVLKLTERQQQAACYLPETMNGQFPIINTQPTGR